MGLLVFFETASRLIATALPGNPFYLILTGFWSMDAKSKLSAVSFSKRETTSSGTMKKFKWEGKIKTFHVQKENLFQNEPIFTVFNEKRE